MAFDAHSNFGYSNVAAPAPGLVGTQLIVAPGQGALFPAAPFNCTVWPAGVQPTAFNAEIVRVTAVVGDTLTITRTQEGSTPVNIEVGFQIANTTSRKVFTDIEAACVIGAGTQTVTGPFTFVDGNGVTFGMDNGSISASVAPGGGGSINFSAGTTSNNLSAITFANGNGITFGLDNGTITAQHNGITQQSTQPIAASASNGSFLFSTIQFADSNGITFGTAPGGIIFASHNGITSQTVQPVAASASNGSFLFSTLRFTDANNVTFGTSAGGIIFASVAPPAAASINVSAGTTSNNLTQLVFSNANGVVFGLDGATVTASFTGGGGQTAILSYSSQSFPPSNFGQSSQVQSRELYNPFIVDCQLSFTRADFLASFDHFIATSTGGWSGSRGVSETIAIMSRSNTTTNGTYVTMFSATQIYSCSITGTSNSWSCTYGGGGNSTTFTSTGQVQISSFRGQKMHTFALTGSLPIGDYIFARQISATHAGYASASSLLAISHFSATYALTNASWAPRFGDNSGSTFYPVQGLGINAGATTANMRSSIALTDITPNAGMVFAMFQLKA